MSASPGQCRLPSIAWHCVIAAAGVVAAPAAPAMPSNTIATAVASTPPAWSRGSLPCVFPAARARGTVWS
ncbi:hypothetical protein XAPC_3772 [Xanthomonas citri pv. punicae str. LMG 859]|nr:hypothetical protein XAPC_3772 [Xanthomonas citri pv. punicae str. LMG 859]